MSKQTFWLAATILLILGAAWRITLAWLLPAISPDGALYLHYARGFAEQGLAYLQTGELEQHPLFPLSVAVSAQLLFTLGWPDTPDTWVWAGQLVPLASGIALILAVGLTSGALARALKQPARPAVLAAMAIAAVLPLNTWHAAEVMSDQLHALWVILGLACATGLPQRRAGAAMGLCAALAFLTRPEGAALLIAAGAAVLMLQHTTIHKRAGIAAILLLTFAATVAPYWYISGGWSPKLDKETIDEATQTALVVHATLTRTELEWYEAPLTATVELFRAGRVIVPLLALIGILAWLPHRTALREPPVLATAVVFVLIYSATHLLLVRHGYLHPRHLMVPTNILVAVSGLTWVVWHARSRYVASMVGVALLLPLMAYSTRVPNGADTALVEIGRWLEDNKGGQRHLLMGGSSERRVAFYADMPFQQWPENLTDADERGTALLEHLVGFGPTHFCIAVGPAEDLTPNRAMLAQLNQRAPGLLEPLRDVPSDRGRRILLFRVFPERG